MINGLDALLDRLEDRRNGPAVNTQSEVKSVYVGENVITTGDTVLNKAPALEKLAAAGQQIAKECLRIGSHGEEGLVIALCAGVHILRINALGQ